MEELWGEAGGTTSSYTYSPTPLGRENGGQPLKCTKRFPGDPLNYVSGPCTIFFPYKVGHRFGPEVDIERTWSKFGLFHVTCPPTHCPPRQRARLAIAPASPVCPPGAFDGRRAQAGAGRLPCPRPPPTGQFRVCPNLTPPTGQFGCVQTHPTNWSA